MDFIVEGVFAIAGAITTCYDYGSSGYRFVSKHVLGYQREDE